MSVCRSVCLLCSSVHQSIHPIIKTVGYILAYSSHLFRAFIFKDGWMLDQTLSEYPRNLLATDPHYIIYIHGAVYLKWNFTLHYVIELVSLLFSHGQMTLCIVTHVTYVTHVYPSVASC